RHLYLEAAKMVKYGNVPEQTALEMITRNPARELGLEHRMGSIEVGKDADLAIFNAHPFDSFARCEMSIIDGEVAFQRREPDGKMDTLAGDGAMPSASEEARTQDVALPQTPGSSFAIVGARIHPVTGPEIEQGTVVVAQGKIAAVGGPETPIPAGAETIDARGLDLWPGMVDAGAILGLFEIGSLSETQDQSDSATFQPELRSSVAIHPDSTIIPVTRANGVLSAYVQPSGGIIAGQGALMDLAGWVPSEMVRVPELALNINIPRYISSSGSGRSSGDANRGRQERLDEVEAMFQRSLEYDKIVSASKDGKVRPPSPDPRLTALVPYARGEKPVIFVADGAHEILDALKLAKTLKLKAIISGGHEAWKVTDALKEAKVPVIISGSLRLPSSSTEPYDSSYTNAAKLFKAGIPFAIRSGGRGPDQATADRNLPYEAATAVAYGLPEAEGLKAVTLYPAQILGVENDLGSIEVGKAANLVLSAGHLLQATTPIKALVIRGQPMKPESKQTKLYQKYRQRLHEVRSGQAPLGLVRKPPGGAAPSSGSTGESTP
ncbi:MAG TPA: amidohydrolase family protein, partial [Isosphaeraceae bacterium]|nr:amidohydrolase family protein [Isosphaeraceae bacterium]